MCDLDTRDAPAARGTSRCWQVRAATPAARAALLTCACLYLPRHVRHVDITPPFHHSFNVCTCWTCHRHEENTQVEGSFTLLSLPPSRILSLFQRGAKGKSRYLFIGNCQRQTPRTCKQTAAVTLLCEHAGARVFQHVKKADDTLMLLVFSWVLLTIREM